MFVSIPKGRSKDIGTTFVGTSEVQAIFGIVVLKSEFHITLNVIDEVIDTEEGLLGSIKAVRFLEFDSKIFILNSSFISFWSFYSGT